MQYTLEQLEPHREILRLNPENYYVDYLATQPDFKTAWDNCQIGPLMLWLADTLGVNRKTIILAKALSVKTASHLMPWDSKKALDVLERYGRGEATELEFEQAMKNAWGDYSKYNDGGDLIAVAIYYCFFTSSYASERTTYATANAVRLEARVKGLDYKKAKTENLAKTAKICRKVLTAEVFEILHKLRRK